VLQEVLFQRLVGLPIELVVGPAFVGYTDALAFRPDSASSTRILESQDVRAFADLRAACHALEWEHGGCQLGSQPVVGAYAGGRLVAVAGYELWGNAIAHIAVITHPQYRGQGYGKAVVSRLTAEVLRQGLVPQYQTLETNTASLAIARGLGFERYATTVAVRLKPDTP